MLIGRDGVRLRKIIMSNIHLPFNPGYNNLNNVNNSIGDIIWKNIEDSIYSEESLEIIPEPKHCYE